MKENSKKVMIIDDNEDILTMLKTMLQMRGYSVFIKMNVISIEDSIIEINPDLIIMDMLLSGSDSRVICKALKNDKRFSQIPILMISAHPNAKENCLKAGADMYLGKPFDMKEIFLSIEKTLQMRKV